MSSYSEYDLERDLREARRARERAAGGYRSTRTGEPSGRGKGDRVMDFIRSRTTDHWVMFAIGLVVGAILL